MKYQIKFDEFSQYVADSLFPGDKLSFFDTCGKSLIKFSTRYMAKNKRLLSAYEKREHENVSSFLGSLMEQLNFSYAINKEGLEKLDNTSPKIFVANHSLGLADIFLLPVIRQFFPSTMMVGNEAMLKLDPSAESCVIGVSMNMNNGKVSKKIQANLKKNNSILIFPSGKVSKFQSSRGVIDDIWFPTFYNLALEENIPIVPIFVNGSPSKLYLYLLNKGNVGWVLSQLLYFRDFFMIEGRHVDVRVGEAINPNDLDVVPNISVAGKVGAIKEQLYSLKNELSDQH